MYHGRPLGGAVESLGILPRPSDSRVRSYAWNDLYQVVDQNVAVSTQTFGILQVPPVLITEL